MWKNQTLLRLKMTADELTETVFAIREKWNSFPCMIQRFLDPKTNRRSLERALVFWAYNPLFRRETFKKHGERFGLKS